MKEFFSNIWFKIVAGLSFVVLVLAYLLNMKGKENSVLKAKLKLADTEEKATELEHQIEMKIAERKANGEKVTQLQSQLDEVRRKKSDLKKQKKLEDKQVEDYWNK